MVRADLLHARRRYVHCEAKGHAGGVKLPPDEALRRRWNSARTASTILKAVAGLVLFLSLIALLPEFDGRRDQTGTRRQARSGLDLFLGARARLRCGAALLENGVELRPAHLELAGIGVDPLHKGVVLGRIPAALE